MTVDEKLQLLREYCQQSSSSIFFEAGEEARAEEDGPRGGRRRGLQEARDPEKELRRKKRQRRERSEKRGGPIAQAEGLGSVLAKAGLREKVGVTNNDSVLTGIEGFMPQTRAKAKKVSRTKAVKKLKGERNAVALTEEQLKERFEALKAFFVERIQFQIQELKKLKVNYVTWIDISDRFYIPFDELNNYNFKQ